jgi:hypothetical protein
MERIANGTLLWKPSYVQLSRPFARGEALAALAGARCCYLPCWQSRIADSVGPVLGEVAEDDCGVGLGGGEGGVLSQ